MDQVNSYVEKGVQMVMDYAPKVALAILMLVIGMKVINKLAKIAVSGMAKAGLNRTAPDLSWCRRTCLGVAGLGIEGVDHRDAGGPPPEAIRPGSTSRPTARPRTHRMAGLASSMQSD